MTPEDVEMLRILVKARSGVVVNPNNTYQLETSLNGAARREGCATADDLIARLRGAGRDERLMWSVTEALSPCDTAFFRDGAPFEALGREILPRFAGREAPVRIWSAACSTGQEAWSIAMTVEDRKAALAGTRVEIYASDISEACINRAKAGVYTQFEVQRGLPIRKLLRYFEKQDESWKVGPAISQAVRWRRISLLSDLAPLGRFEVIFARNVVRYFDRATRRKVLDQLMNLLSDDGYLVLGVGEEAEDMEGLHPAPCGAGVYMRRPSSRAQAA